MDEIEKYYNSVADLIGKEDFERKVQGKVEASDGLISSETAARMVAAELGRTEIRIDSISSLKEGKGAVIEGYIEGISDIREFTTKNGREGRVMNVTIVDDSGACRLVLWNRDTLIKDKLKKDMKIRVVNCKVKESMRGIELSLTKWSSIWVEVDGEMLQIR
jgi:ssDNA-binding replication factor A large subunit